jgi:small-conductance mechanosensitive channel
MVEPLPFFDSSLETQYALVLTQLLYFVVSFVVVFLVGWVVLLPGFDRIMSARGLGVTIRKPLRKLGGVLVAFVAVAIAFGFAGFGNFLTSLATVAAAGTLAVGFAMQDVLKNFVGGVFIFTDKPFRIGDWIEWDGNSGVVEDISFRVTRVRTFDNELLTVPNSKLTQDVVKNPVAKDTLRVKFLFGISYEADIDTASRLIVEEAHNHPDILENPAPGVRVTELADSYVGLQSRIWIADPSRADFVKIRGEYVTTVKNRFDQQDIEIPFPQRDLSGAVDFVGFEPDEVARTE